MTEKFRSRYLESAIVQDLPNKLILLSGPRQVGKTSLAVNLLPTKSRDDPGYLNWDIPSQREKIRRGFDVGTRKLWVLDEIHKFARWRNLLKGLYDEWSSKIHFLITGSARLDHYSRGGDALTGRYQLFRMHPLSARELSANPTLQDIKHLLTFGGFPEPCIAGNTRTLKRWQQSRLTQVLDEDLRNLERVRETSLLELLVDALPNRVGSPLSLRSLMEDLQVSHDSISRWMTILDSLFVTFRIAPWGTSKLRAVKKEQKMYLWDWSMIDDEGARFENLVASQLMKFCHFEQDTNGERMELRYFRDTDGREVDFIVIKNKKPLFAVECKLSEKSASPALRYLRERSSVPALYQVHMGSSDIGNSSTDGRVLPLHTFVSEQKFP